MQQTKDMPQPQDPQTQNPLNNDSSDTTPMNRLLSLINLMTPTTAMMKMILTWTILKLLANLTIPDTQQTRRYNQTVSVSLPTTEQVIRYQKWNNQPTEELAAAKGMYAKAVIGSPHTPELHTKEKEASHYSQGATVWKIEKPIDILGHFVCYKSSFYDP